MTTYALRNDDDERTRLIGQSQWLATPTRQLFVAAGLAPGMRVLDFGSGAGDVALLARDLVGVTGEIVGVDRDPAQVAFANARVAELGLGNVRFVVGDADHLPDGPFDAAVGRLVLLYAVDPAVTLTALAARVRPGGVLAFHEMDIPTDRTTMDVWPPRDPRLQHAVEVAVRTMQAVAHTELGRKLPALLGAFGQARASAFTALFSPEPMSLWTDLLGSLLPQAEMLGIAAPGAVDLDALRAMPDAPGSTLLVFSLVAAWVRLA